MAASEDLRVSGKVYFLTRSPLYHEVKPYTLRYRSEDGFPQTNVVRTLHDIVFQDLRTQPDLTYEKCCFKVINLQSSLSYEDYDDLTMVEKVHQKEVTECVKDELKATSVEVLDYVIRRRDPSWPIATGETYSFQQPASAAHIDHTYDEGCRIIRDVYGTEADAVIRGRWQIVNVWHPLRGPLIDWPLALCDASSVDFVHDTMAGDVVDRDAVFENTQVYYNSDQRWYYLPNQLPLELLIFKNADSETMHGAAPGVPHASFDNPRKGEHDLMRESIELRLLVRW
ncbi:hypothetical protein OIDMADRAFT_60671 [Oidiodendron maius Zn]|uniref:Methyltransferase n=1 Tax=Oidiodendron maius (strain Zn) TaxID=913774 RepID=A0A0C3GVJ8_OIDMZ|nr:hypothetical protein OIDMADRAFT_60671 [Oidiodendron maius Zn]